MTQILVSPFSLSYSLITVWLFFSELKLFFVSILRSNSLLRFSADKPANPNTIASPIYESSLEYSIRITDRVLPKIEGSIDNTKSQLPQHPRGTREKKEKKELRAVLPEPVPRIPFFFLSKLQPKPIV